MRKDLIGETGAVISIMTYKPCTMSLCPPRQNYVTHLSCPVAHPTSAAFDHEHASKRTIRAYRGESNKVLDQRLSFPWRGTRVHYVQPKSLITDLRAEQGEPLFFSSTFMCPSHVGLKDIPYSSKVHIRRCSTIEMMPYRITITCHEPQLFLAYKTRSIAKERFACQLGHQIY